MQQGTCRRNSLLSLIGQAPVACSGCDVCNDSAASRAEGEQEIFSLIARHRRRFNPTEAAEILCAAAGPRPIRLFQDCIAGWGGLEGWMTHEAEAALQALVWQGRLRFLSRGPWKGRVTIPR
jgi:hypothetical protein